MSDREGNHFAHRILLVDDDAETLEALAEVLDDMGHEVVGASSAREAMNCLGTDRYDILLSDVQMPGMSGPELATWAHRHYPHMRIILTSGAALDPARVQADWRFIPKPVNLAALQTIM